ncbi:MAG: hypothetical protein LBE31_01745 [Deltaproteobacteria bacterium]|jgi:hypothetical protein|nr:hypothetical protein [Deltaproteobacteria bacterium]
MNAHEIIGALLSKDSGKAALFSPLDENGLSVMITGHDSAITLIASPEETESLYFSLVAPLLTLEGANANAQFAFLWHLAAESAPGALPPGYVLFADSEDLSVYLGAQFSAQGLEIATLETLADEVFRYAQVVRENLIDVLQDLSSMDLSQQSDQQIGQIAGESTLQIPLNQEMLRV